MDKRKISKRNLKKCRGFDLPVCYHCKRQSNDEPERLVMGVAHGKCEHRV